MDYIFLILGVILAAILAVILTIIHRRSSRPPHPYGPPRPPRPPSLDSSPLGLIPPEILQHIVSYLPPSIAASLALSCLPIRLAVGTQYLRALRASRAETVALLELIVADLPNDPLTGIPKLLLCVHCARLVPSTRGCGKVSTPACRQAWSFSKQYLDKAFHHAYFHTAMVMHRHGRSPDALLRHFTPRTATVKISEELTAHAFVDYYVQSGSLVRRSQLIHVVPHAADYNYLFSRRPCAHGSSYQKKSDAATTYVQKRALGGTHRSSSDFIRCNFCRTVVHLGACKFRSGCIGTFLTWWSDLGDGRLGDEKWAEHMRGFAETEKWTAVSYRTTYLTSAIKPKNERYFWEFDELFWTR